MAKPVVPEGYRRARVFFENESELTGYARILSNGWVSILTEPTLFVSDAQLAEAGEKLDRLETQHQTALSPVGWTAECELTRARNHYNVLSEIRQLSINSDYHEYPPQTIFRISWLKESSDV